MKQWMKYTAVMCSFLIMIGVFFPNSGNKVSASETETVSGSDAAATSTEGTEATSGETEGSSESKEGAYVENTNTESWTVTINYNVDGNVVGTTVPTISGGLFGFTVESAPEKSGYEFQGWLCSVTGAKEDSGSLEGANFSPGTIIEYTYNCSDYNGSTITFTAQWKDSYQDAVKVIYDNGDGTVFKEETITQQLVDNVYESVFNIAVPSETPAKEEYTFTGWICSADNAAYAAGSSAGSFEWADYSSGDSSNPNIITFTAQWEAVTEEDPESTETGVISEGGSYTLIAGKEYTLGDGTWTVSGDSSTIYNGGIPFYVGSTGTYTFTKQIANE